MTELMEGVWQGNDVKLKTDLLLSRYEGFDGAGGGLAPLLSSKLRKRTRQLCEDPRTGTR